jgi:hypothetical protein
MIAFALLSPRSLGVQRSSRGVEVDLVGRHCGAEEPDGEVQVEQGVLGLQVRDEAVRHCAPVGMELHRRHREDEQAEPPVTEDPLDPLEGDHPDDHAQRDDHCEDEPPVRESRQEPHADGHAADLGRERQQVDDLGGDERDEAPAEADPLTHGIEDGLLGDRCDATAHLRVDDDPDHADDDDPQELVAERRAGGHVEDEVADVDEAADGREDPERDLEDLHAQPPCCSNLGLSFAASSGLDGSASSWSNSTATAPAFFASLRTAFSIPGAVGRVESASWKLDARVESSPAWTRENGLRLAVFAISLARSAPSHASESIASESLSSACWSTVPPLQPERTGRTAKRRAHRRNAPPFPARDRLHAREREPEMSTRPPRGARAWSSRTAR